MSIFPRHLGLGHSLTVHARVAVSEPCVPLLSVAIRDPRAQLVFEEHRQLSWSMPWMAADEVPLLLLAEGAGAQPKLARTLSELRNSMHTYRSYTVPENAPLGRYNVEIVLWVDGQAYASDTAASDCFFVEALELQHVERSARGFAARIHNPSPETVRAQLIELPSAGAPHARSLELQGLSSIDLCGDAEHAVLAYADGASVLPLRLQSSPIYVRNQSCAWTQHSDGSLLVTDRRRSKSYRLNGQARTVWLAADGLRDACGLRALAPSGFEALCSAQLLQIL